MKQGKRLKLRKLVIRFVEKRIKYNRINFPQISIPLHKTGFFSRSALPICLQVCYQLWHLKLMKWWREMLSLNYFLWQEQYAEWNTRLIVCSHRGPKEPATLYQYGMSGLLVLPGKCTAAVLAWPCFCQSGFATKGSAGVPCLLTHTHARADNARTCSRPAEPALWGQEVEILKCVLMVSDLDWLKPL